MKLSTALISAASLLHTANSYAHQHQNHTAYALASPRPIDLKTSNFIDLFKPSNTCPAINLNRITYAPMTEHALLSNQPTHILDGDGGGDEATLASVLLSHGLSLDALTSVAGNVGCDAVSENMHALIHWLGYPNIPAYPCQEEANARDGAHGSNGLAGVTLPDSPVPKQTINSVDFLLKRVANAPKESIVLFASGPLTNIAELLKREPRCAESIQQLLVMGGSLRDMPAPNDGTRRGNITPDAEFNFFSDPSAAAYVLKTLNNKVTLFPMDCTHQLTFTADRAEQLNQLDLPAHIKETLTTLFNGPAELELDKFGISPVIHDTHLALYYVRPDLYDVETQRVCVTESGPQQGRTEQCNDGPPLKVCTKLTDPNEAFTLISESYVKHFGERDPSNSNEQTAASSEPLT